MPLHTLSGSFHIRRMCVVASVRIQTRACRSKVGPGTAESAGRGACGQEMLDLGTCVSAEAKTRMYFVLEQQDNVCSERARQRQLAEMQRHKNHIHSGAGS